MKREIQLFSPVHHALLGRGEDRVARHLHLRPEDPSQTGDIAPFPDFRSPQRRRER